MKLNRKKIAILTAMAAAALLAAGFIAYFPAGKSMPGEKADTGEMASIPDGLSLYSFLLREIPEIVSQVPCACCNHALSWCYQGGCPPT